MDIQKDFKDLNLDEKEMVVEVAKELEVTDDNLDESEKMIRDLEKRIANIKTEEKTAVAAKDSAVNVETAVENISTNLETQDDVVVENEDELVSEPVEQTALEKFQPFILPVCLTLFAIFFAALFLYFFSKSRVDNSQKAIVNTGTTEIIKYVEKPIVKQEPVIVAEIEPPTCVENQKLNDAKDACEDLLPPPVVEVPKFENGTTTVVNVRFSFDKFNYDNYPTGIYLNETQIFEGDYKDFKILPTNRSYANDFFFGVDRNMVSLLGSCKYVVDEAQILVSNMRDSEGDQVYSAIKDRYFRGKVVKILDASKPHINCKK